MEGIAVALWLIYRFYQIGLGFCGFSWLSQVPLLRIELFLNLRFALSHFPPWSVWGLHFLQLAFLKARTPLCNSLWQCRVRHQARESRYSLQLAVGSVPTDETTEIENLQLGADFLPWTYFLTTEGACTSRLGRMKTYSFWVLTFPGDLCFTDRLQVLCPGLDGFRSSCFSQLFRGSQIHDKRNIMWALRLKVTVILFSPCWTIFKDFFKWRSITFTVLPNHRELSWTLKLLTLITLTCCHNI